MININLEKCKSTQILDVICDYCGKCFKRKKHHVVKLRKVLPKDSCGEKECTVKKRAESTIALHGEECFKKKFLEKSKKSNLKKYGVENPSQSNKIKNKIKKTNLKKYGVISYLATKDCKEQTRNKAIELYGVDHFSKAEEVKIKSKKTSIEKHGDLFQKTKKWKDKVKQSCFEKYGVDSVSKVDKFKKKQTETLIKKYGVNSPLKNCEIKEKQKNTLKKKYGVESALRSPILLEKMKKTCVERYGCEHAMKNVEIKTKSIKKRIEKYGSLISNLGKTQKEITDWLNGYGFNFNSNYELLKGKELDLYDENKKLALEYCGLYWHNENSPQPRTRSYHYDKWKTCDEKNIQLLTIFDDEWNNKKEICKSLILSKLGIFEKRIYARKCEVKEISKKEMGDFCDLYHLQGANKLSTVCFGLFYENELCAVVDLGRHHRKKDKDILVLTRLCFKSGFQVVGGASKLFKACINYCKENNIKNIISWSDNRYSDGKIYKKLGFNKVEDLKPDYYYVNVKNPKKRISKQSQSKKNSNCPKEMTELEWANSRGLSRIWDCGKTRWNYILI